MNSEKNGIPKIVLRSVIALALVFVMYITYIGGRIVYNNYIKTPGAAGRQVSEEVDSKDTYVSGVYNCTSSLNGAVAVSTLNSGEYELSDDVTLDSTWVIDGDVSIDLAGHKLIGADAQDVLRIDGGNSLILSDSAGGGQITHAPGETGGGVYNSGTFTMTGGMVTENSGSTYGGVYNSGTFEVSGNPQITGNTKGGDDNNVFLPDGNVISIIGTLTSGTQIGVSMEIAGVFTGGLSGYGDISAFSSDDNGLTVTAGAGGEALLDTPTPVEYTITWNVNGGDELTGVYTSGSVPYGEPILAPASPTRAGHVFTGWDKPVPATMPAENLEFTAQWNHVHNWSYIGSETTITAECTDGCDINSGLDLTISAPVDLTYDGSVKVASLSADYNTTAFPGVDSSSIAYKKNGSDINADEVMDVGSYTAEYTYEGATASVGFEIGEAEAVLTTVPVGNADLVYNKTEQPLLTVSGTAAGGTLMYRTGTEGEFGTAVPTAVNADTYDVYYYVDGDDNHSSLGNTSNPLGPVSVRIEKKEVGLDWGESRFAYDRNPHKPTAIATGLCDGDICSVDVEGERIAAGSYTADATGLSNANYRLPYSRSHAFTISGASISGDARYGETLTATITPAGDNPAYQWYTCDSSGNNASPIAGATASALLINNASLVSKYVKAVITVNGTPYNSDALGEIAKADGPAAPEVSVVKTTNSITVVSPQQTSPAIFEYKLITDTVWRETSEFPGLQPDTEYTVAVRIKETLTHNAGDIREISVRTDQVQTTKLATPDARFIATGTSTGTLSNVENGMAYKIGNGDWVNIVGSDDVRLTGLSACVISVIRQGVENVSEDSDVQEITVTKASTPQLTVEQPSRLGDMGTVNTGIVHEYSSNNGESWAQCSVDQSFSAGTYLIRIRAEGHRLASDNQSVTIEAFMGHKAETPEAVFTATGADMGTLTDVASGMQYSTNGVDWVDINAESVSLTGLSAGTIKVIRKGNMITMTDSEPQSITVSKAETPDIEVTQPQLIGAKGMVATTAGIHEYSGDSGVNWTDCSTDEMLDPGEYQIRVKAAGTTLASDPKTVRITEFEGEKETTPSAGFTATDSDRGKLTGLEAGVNYTVSGSAISQRQNITADDNGEFMLAGLVEGNLSVVKNGNGTTTRNSDEQVIAVNKGTVPNAVATDCTDDSNTDGEITNVTDNMQYKASYWDYWNTCVGDRITGLTPGIYYVRTKPDGDRLASDQQVIEILAYAALGQVVAPTFSPAPGKYQDALSVSLACTTPGATIYYTLNGTIPTSACQTYNGSIMVTATTTIRAIGVRDDMDDSSVSTAVYTIEAPECALDIADVTFDAMIEGYIQPAAKAIMITNAGDCDALFATISLTGENADSFELDDSGANNRVPVGAKNTGYRVRPRAGLGVGTYTATVDLTYGPDPAPASPTQAGNASARITFTVDPAPVYYDITVENGTGDKTKAVENEVVTITADAPAQGKVFDKWISSDGVAFADETKPETTFIMPAKAVTVTATYKDEEKPDPPPVDEGTPTPVEGLVYNGQEQELVTPVKADDGMRYSLDGVDFSTAIPKAKNAGEYTVSYRKNDGDDVKTVTAVIAKRKLQVTAINLSKKAGEKDPDLKYIVSGIAEGEAEAEILTGSLVRAEGETAGTYEITQGTLALTQEGEINYELEFISAQLTIDKPAEEKNVSADCKLENTGVPSSVSAVTVNGLEKYAQTVNGKNIAVHMAVSPVAESGIAASILSSVGYVLDKLFSGISSAYVHKEYLNIQVTKTVDGGAPQAVSELTEPVEICLTVDLAGKYKPVIVREHGGSVAKFKKVSSRPSGKYTDGTYCVTGTNTIYIYSRLYSTYALAYTTKPSWEVTWDDGLDGSEITTNIVENGSKLTKPTNPKRSGYTFQGWYDDYGHKWNFSKDTVDEDTNLTGRWKKKSSSTTSATTTTTATKSTSSSSSTKASTSTGSTSTSTGSGTASAGGAAAQSAAAGAGSAGAAAGAAGGAKTADPLPSTPLWIVLELFGIMLTLAAAIGYRDYMKKRRRSRDD